MFSSFQPVTKTLQESVSVPTLSFLGLISFSDHYWTLCSSTEIWKFTICTSPIIHLVCHPEFCITFVFNSPGHYSGPREIKDTAYAQLFGGGGTGAKKVHYGRCVNGEFKCCACACQTYLSSSSQSSPPHVVRNSLKFIPPTRVKSALYIANRP